MVLKIISSPRQYGMQSGRLKRQHADFPLCIKSAQPWALPSFLQEEKSEICRHRAPFRLTSAEGENTMRGGK